MAQSYTVSQHDTFKGAQVRVIKRIGSKHTHIVLVEAISPHVRLPKGERFEMDMRDLKLNTDTRKWLEPYEMKDLNLMAKKDLR